MQKQQPLKTTHLCSLLLAVTEGKSACLLGAAHTAAWPAFAVLNFNFFLCFTVRLYYSGPRRAAGCTLYNSKEFGSTQVARLCQKNFSDGPEFLSPPPLPGADIRERENTIESHQE